MHGLCRLCSSDSQVMVLQQESGGVVRLHLKFPWILVKHLPSMLAVDFLRKGCNVEKQGLMSAVAERFESKSVEKDKVQIIKWPALIRYSGLYRVFTCNVGFIVV